MKLTIKLRLIAGFSSISLVLVIVLITSIAKLSGVANLTKQSLYVYSPAIQEIAVLKAVVNNMNALTKNWILAERQEDTPDKLLLKEIVAVEYPLFRDHILNVSTKWSTNDTTLLNETLLSIDSLLELQNSIMGELSTFDSYDDPMVVFGINPLVEADGEFTVLYNSIQEKLNMLDAIFDKKGKDSAEEAISSLSGFSLIILVLIVIGLVVSITVSIFTIKSIIQPINTLKQSLLNKSEGDFTGVVNKVYDDELGDMTDSLSIMSKNLKSIIIAIKHSSGVINESSTRIDNSSKSILDGASVQASTTEEISSSIEEIQASISSNSDNSKEAEFLSTKLDANISTISDSVKETALGIEKTIKQIKSIDSIAEKIDILAINASIEAARAGEYGLGFSVVAAEIRKLAEKSQEVSVEINTVSNNSYSIASTTNELLQSMLPEIKRTLTSVQEISRANEQQKSGIDLINSAIIGLSDITNHNVLDSEKLTANADELIKQAQDLISEIAFFRT